MHGEGTDTLGLGDPANDQQTRHPEPVCAGIQIILLL